LLIECICPSECLLYGDNGNLMLLKQSFKDATFINDELDKEPYFVNHKIDLLLLGSMKESMQEALVKYLLPYKERIKEMIKEGTYFLFTGNALEILGERIINEDESFFTCLNLYPFVTVRYRPQRYNCLYRGKYADLNVVGYKSTFSFIYGDNPKPFLNTEIGYGANKEDEWEGIKDHNLFATNLLGPFLICNPIFTKALFNSLNGEEVEIPFYEQMLENYKLRLQSFSRKNLKVYY